MKEEIQKIIQKIIQNPENFSFSIIKEYVKIGYYVSSILAGSEIFLIGLEHLTITQLERIIFEKTLECGALKNEIMEKEHEKFRFSNIVKPQDKIIQLDNEIAELKDLRERKLKVLRELNNRKEELISIKASTQAYYWKNFIKHSFVITTLCFAVYKLYNIVISTKIKQ